MTWTPPQPHPAAWKVHLYVDSEAMAVERLSGPDCNVTHVISITDVGRKARLPTPDTRPKVLRIELDDMGMEKDDELASVVMAICRFCREMTEGKVPSASPVLLVHCSAGISRSVAAAMVAMAYVHGRCGGEVARHVYACMTAPGTPMPHEDLLRCYNVGLASAAYDEVRRIVRRSRDVED